MSSDEKAPSLLDKNPTNRFFVLVFICIAVAFVCFVGLLTESNTVHEVSGNLNGISITSINEVIFYFENETVVLDIDAGQFLLDYAGLAKELEIYGYYWDIWSHISFSNTESTIYYKQSWFGLGRDHLVYWSAEKTA